MLIVCNPLLPVIADHMPGSQATVHNNLHFFFFGLSFCPIFDERYSNLCWKIVPFWICSYGMSLLFCNFHVHLKRWLLFIWIMHLLKISISFIEQKFALMSFIGKVLQIWHIDVFIDAFMIKKKYRTQNNAINVWWCNGNNMLALCYTSSGGPSNRKMYGS